MESLIKKLKLIKANLMPSLRSPGIAPPKPPKMPSAAPKSKKNPIKVAEQVSDKNAKAYAMRQAIQQVKSNTTMAPTLKSEGVSYFHVVKDERRISDAPLTMDEVHQNYGGVEDQERNGIKIVPIVNEYLHQHSNGQWSLRRK